jgi:hypothetical protein
MEEQEQYTPATEEAPIEASEVEGGQVEGEEGQQVEEEQEPTSAPETLIPLKAVQEERRKRQELKEDRDFWHKVATGELANPLQQPQITKPKPEQFNDYDEYVEALADYKANQIFEQRTHQTQQLTRQQLAQREEQRLLAKAKTDVEQASKRYADFETVVASVFLPTATLKAMYESEIGADLAYHLGKNPSEMERIQEMSPNSQIRELGKLEAKLAAKLAKPESKQVKNATQVEDAGGGFNKPRQNLSKLKERAISTGDWTDYLEATGNL